DFGRSEAFFGRIEVGSIRGECGQSFPTTLRADPLKGHGAVSEAAEKARRDAGGALEAAREMRRRRKAAGKRNVGHGHGAGFKQRLGMIKTALQKIPMGRYAHRSLERAREVDRTEASLPRQFLQGQIVIELGIDEG